MPPPGIALPAPEGAESYEVRWVEVEQSIGSELSGPFIVRRANLSRKRAPLSKAVVKTWMDTVADCEVVDYKGLPCIWRAKPALVAKYGLLAELPAHVVSTCVR